MPNEREVKQGLARGICSATGERCVCGSGRGCSDRRSVSKTQAVNLKTALIYCDVIKDVLDRCLSEEEQTRPWPVPELRDVRRKIVTVEAMLEEVLGG